MALHEAQQSSPDTTEAINHLIDDVQRCAADITAAFAAQFDCREAEDMAGARQNRIAFEDASQQQQNALFELFALTGIHPSIGIGLCTMNNRQQFHNAARTFKPERMAVAA